MVFGLVSGKQVRFGKQKYKGRIVPWKEMTSAKHNNQTGEGCLVKGLQTELAGQRGPVEVSYPIKKEGLLRTGSLKAPNLN